MSAWNRQNHHFPTGVSRLTHRWELSVVLDTMFLMSSESGREGGAPTRPRGEAQSQRCRPPTMTSGQTEHGGCFWMDGCFLPLCRTERPLAAATARWSLLALLFSWSGGCGSSTADVASLIHSGISFASFFLLLLSLKSQEKGERCPYLGPCPPPK